MSKKKKNKKIDRYLNNNEIEIIKPPKINWFKIIIISIISGIIGGTISNQIQITNIKEPKPIEQQKSEITNKKPKAQPIIVKSLENDFKIENIKSVVGIYQIKTLKQKNLIDEIISEKNFISNGIILTSDGWIAVPKNLENYKNLIILHNNKTFQIKDSILFDPVTQTSFFKINTQNLPVTPLNFTYTFTKTHKVAIPNVNNEILITKILNENHKFSNDKFKVHNTETFYNYPIVKKLPSKYIGAPVYNTENQIIGFIKQNLEDKSIIQPISRIQPLLRNIFKQKQILRPFLGINYIDISEIPENKLENYKISTKIGALLYKNPKYKINIFSKNSNLKEIFKPGDIILKVNNEEITSEKTLTEIIQDYPPGSNINFLILRDGIQKNIQIKLKSFNTKK